jgi:nitrogen fixation NifU-like protein
MNDVYVEEILDHFRNPRNYGELEGADIVAKDVNTLCGDGFQFFIKTENGSIKDVRFKGEGCAISTASASILSDFIKGKNVKDVSDMKSEEMISLLQIPISQARMKCALIPLEIVKSGLGNGGVNKC